MQATKPFDIICLSTAHWDAPLWTNRQRLMNIYTQNHRVLFVEPGLYSKSYTLDFVRRQPGRLQPSQWIHKEKENLWVYSPNLLPLYRYSPQIQNRAWAIALRHIQKFCRQNKMDQPVLWLYSPAAIGALGHLNESLVVYDCVDNYAATPYYAKSRTRAELLQKQENRLLQCADLVTTTSHSLFEEKNQINHNTHFVPNVGDAEHFGKALLSETPIAEDIAEIQKPIIGFIGAVNAHKLDFDLIVEIARKSPQFQYVFIGPTAGWGGNTDTSRLNLPNIHLLGARDYNLLPNYLKAFDICIIPYALNSYTQHVFPLKFYEFMAAGKPIVATPLPSLSSQKDMIYIAETAEKFVGSIHAALDEHDGTIRQKRIDLARQNTWQHRAMRIEELVTTALQNKYGKSTASS